jgi:hypothetical protein
MARNQDVPLPMLLEGGALAALQLDLKTGTVGTLELAERPCRERASLGSTPKVAAAVAVCIRVATIRESFLDLPLPAASDVLHGITSALVSLFCLLCPFAPCVLFLPVLLLASSLIFRAAAGRRCLPFLLSALLSVNVFQPVEYRNIYNIVKGRYTARSSDTGTSTHPNFRSIYALTWALSICRIRLWWT